MTGMKVFLGIVFSLVTVVCGPGNCLLCFLIARHKRLRSVTNLLIANLAVSDALVALVSTPFALHYYMKQNWVLPDFMCPLMNMLKNVSLFVSVNTLLVIAVDRYHGIFNPLMPRMKKATLVVIVIITWLVSILVATPTALYTRVHVGYCRGKTFRFCAEYWKNIHVSRAYILSLALVEFLVPMVIMACIYLSIATKLWLHRHPPGHVTARHREITLVRKQKTIPMLVALVVAFCFCWAPYHAYNIAFQFYYDQMERLPYYLVIMYIVEGLAMLNAVVGTIIYFGLSPVFRKELAHLFRKAFSCWRHPAVSTSQTRTSHRSAGSQSSNIPRLNGYMNGSRKPTVETIDTRI
ncbi:prokineticin receptor 2-like [Diadema antillarum]